MLLRDLIAKLGGEAIGEVAKPLTAVGTIEGASDTQITFLANPKYRTAAGRTGAGAVIVGPEDRDATSQPRIVSTNPYAYFARVAQLLSPVRPSGSGIHASAVVHPGARIAAGVSIAEFVSIGVDAVIGERVRIGAGAVIGDNVTIGADSIIASRVTIYQGCRVGSRAIIHSGAVIGADGFGFAPDFADGKGSWIKIPQTGRVIIGEDCEIGANTTIDRGAIEDTIIGDDVKLDNQIQIAHNCSIGDHTVIAGCVGMAGSTKIGRRVMVGGAAGFAGHLEVCDGAVISAMTLVTKSITEPGTYTAAIPQMKHQDWLKNVGHLRRLDKLAQEVAAIKKKGSAS